MPAALTEVSSSSCPLSIRAASQLTPEGFGEDGWDHLVQLFDGLLLETSCVLDAAADLLDPGHDVAVVIRRPYGDFDSSKLVSFHRCKAATFGQVMPFHHDHPKQENSVTSVFRDPINRSMSLFARTERADPFRKTYYHVYYHV